MKNSIFVISTALLLGAVAQAAAPGIVIVKGTIYRQTNVEGQCGASTFGYIVDGTYISKAGTLTRTGGCLEAIAVPLGGMMDAGLSDEIFRDSTNVLKSAAGKPATMTFAIGDIDNFEFSSGTLLSIEVDQKAK